MSKNEKIVPVVLAGGQGTRLWPMSRSARPKQFLPLTGERSLFQQTLLRLTENWYTAPIVITNEDYRFLVAEQAQECGVVLRDILLEPVARNTAAAIASASFLVADDNPKSLLHILASDHEITVDDAYTSAIETAVNSARGRYLTTFGITPTEPATGFGYIEAGDDLPGGARAVNRFIEKPKVSKAEKMFEAGNFFWNSGMFLFAADTFLAECEILAPKVFGAAKNAVADAQKDLDFIRLERHAFASAPNISVDYAIFEKTTRAAVVPSPIVWSDLGSWDAVWKAIPHDADSNVIRGPSSVSNTKGSLIVSEKLHVAVDGVEDIAVIASEDAVYVGRLSSAQKVGAIVASLKAQTSTANLTENHKTTYRPWGGYTSVLDGDRFQVKKLFVKPGKRLSLQKHHHRSEHWIVVRGIAEVQVGEDTTTLRENQSTYIPQGELHRLTNPGKILLELIEVQTGSYLGEDDIIRVEDEFGRN